MKYVVKEQYRLQKTWHLGETDMKQELLRMVMATERIGIWEIPSPVRRDLGCGIDRNTGSQIRGVPLLYFISRAVLLISHATQEISSL